MTASSFSQSVTPGMCHRRAVCIAPLPGSGVLPVPRQRRLAVTSTVPGEAELFQSPRKLATRKVGHAGTLDPMATGLLVLGVGRATRLLRYLGDLEKTYEGSARLGEETDTLDAEGTVTRANRSALSALELDPATRSTVTSGVLWVTFVFAGTLGLNRSLPGLWRLLIRPLSSLEDGRRLLHRPAGRWRCGLLPRSIRLWGRGFLPGPVRLWSRGFLLRLVGLLRRGLLLRRLGFAPFSARLRLPGRLFLLFLRDSRDASEHQQKSDAYQPGDRRPTLFGRHDNNPP